MDKVKPSLHTIKHSPLSFPPHPKLSNRSPSVNLLLSRRYPQETQWTSPNPSLNKFKRQPPSCCKRAGISHRDCQVGYRLQPQNLNRSILSLEKSRNNRPRAAPIVRLISQRMAHLTRRVRIPSSINTQLSNSNKSQTSVNSPRTRCAWSETHQPIIIMKVVCRLRWTIPLSSLISSWMRVTRWACRLVVGIFNKGMLIRPHRNSHFRISALLISNNSTIGSSPTEAISLKVREANS